MLKHTRCKVLILHRIIKEKSNWTERNFIFMIENYLLRYPNYLFLYEKDGFAICDREDEVKERRRKRS